MKKIKVVWLVISVAVMALIFFFSHQTAEVSSQTSGGLARVLADIIGVFFKGDTYERVLWVAQWTVRKSAHFILFAILGMSVYNTINIPRRGTRFFLTLGICILYAIADEVHQLFIPGRSCEVGDMLIDSLGAVAFPLWRFSRSGNPHNSAQCEMRSELKEKRCDN